MTSDCTPCGRVYKTVKAFQQHLRDSPAHATTHDCGECSRAFGTEQALNQHLRDSPAHATTHDCGECSRAFGTEQALNQHLRDSPAHVTTHDCDECSRVFGTEQALDQHLRDSLYCSRSTKSFGIWPSLHSEVARLLEDDNLFFEFYEADEAHTATHDYDSHVMGRFVCKNARCLNKGWSSKKIAITVRMYSDAQYNARVYHQSCKVCKNLARPILDNTYAERIAYRLKRWSGIEMRRPFYSGQSKGPHETDLCEGCKNGHCRGQD
jgi:hypothetical protein